MASQNAVGNSLYCRHHHQNTPKPRFATISVFR